MGAALRFLGVLCAVWIAFLTSAPAAAAPPRVVVEKGRRAAEMIVVMGTPVQVDGTAASGVFAAGSDVVVNGVVEGDVAVIGGTFTMTAASRVTGNVLLIGSDQKLADGSTIEGKLFASGILGDDVRQFLTNPFGYLFSHSYDALSVAKRIFFSLAWFVIAMVIIKLFPAHVSFACKRTRQDFKNAFGIGIVSAVAAFVSLILSVLLCLVLVGIPLLGLLALFLLAALAFGVTAFLCVTGELLASVLKLRNRRPMVCLLLSLTAWTLLRFIPGVSFLVQLAVITAALGITVGTHFGKGTPWFSRRRLAKPA